MIRDFISKYSEVNTTQLQINNRPAGRYVLAMVLAGLMISLCSAFLSGCIAFLYVHVFLLWYLPTHKADLDLGVQPPTST
jgi:hypothetical protein